MTLFKIVVWAIIFLTKLQIELSTYMYFKIFVSSLYVFSPSCVYLQSESYLYLIGFNIVIVFYRAATGTNVTLSIHNHVSVVA